MEIVHPDQFLGLPACPLEEADVAILPLPLEKTVSYGTGTWRAPRAILEASCQLETFDEETLVDFAEAPKVHTLPPLVAGQTVEAYLEAVRQRVARLRNRLVVGLGGEHTITFGMVSGLVEDPADVTIVQLDAHADLIDVLDGQPWSHGTVMRRLWDRGCRLIQIGIRSLSREEYDLATTDDRIRTYFAHQMTDRWDELLDVLHGLEGPVYLTLDVDGLDPSIIPSTGTPQPGGITWQQAMAILRALTMAPECRLIGADLVELIASAHLPGCDIIAARLLAKLLAFWHVGSKAAGVPGATDDSAGKG